MQENLFNENHRSIWSCCLCRIKMNMIYKCRRRSASNDPFARAFLCLLRFVPLREKCRYSEFFWSIYSRIRTEYWDSCHLSVFCRNDQISVQIRKTPNKDTFRAVCVLTFASVHYSMPVYTVTTLKVMQRKTENTAWDVRLY